MIKDRLLRILQAHQGVENAITSKELSQALGIRDSAAQPVTRGLIRRMIESEGWPVGACSSGYFWITTKTELAEYLGELSGRMAGIMKRRLMVEENYRKFGGR